MRPQTLLQLLFLSVLVVGGSLLAYRYLRSPSELTGPRVFDRWHLHDQPNEAVRTCLAASSVTLWPKPKAGAIVMAFTLDRRNHPSTNAVLDNWQTYADLHGYDVVPSWVDMTQYAQYSSFFTARWAALLANDELWDSYPWFLHLDGDSLVYNMSIPVTQFLMPGADAVLQVRENFEVSAAVSLWKTSAFSRCFIRYFAHVASWTGRDANWDNGDLLQALLDLVDPDLGRHCRTFRNTSGEHYGSHFIPCFSRVMPRLQVVHSALPIRLYWPLEGFWRSHEGQAPEAVSVPWRALHHRCYSNDFILHGWKAMPLRMWAQRNGSATPVCHRMPLQNELALAQRCCLWHYPGGVTALFQKTGT